MTHKFKTDIEALDDWINRYSHYQLSKIAKEELKNIIEDYS